MTLVEKIIIALLLLNGIQGIVVAYFLRGIVSEMGKKPNYFLRMTGDQIFLYRKITNDQEGINHKGILRYSIVVVSIQLFLFVSLIVLLSNWSW